MFAIAETESALAEGKCVVIGLLSTGEAKANEAAERENRAGRWKRGFGLAGDGVGIMNVAESLKMGVCAYFWTLKYDRPFRKLLAPTTLVDLLTAFSPLSQRA
jgi:hypothetical protein